MRKIVYRNIDHNIRRAVSLAVLLLIVGLGGSCGQDDADRHDNKAATSDTAGPATSGGRCQVTVNIQPWNIFADLADRLAAGQTVPRAEIEAYAELPTVTAWRRSQAPNVPRPENLANWIEGAWWEEQGRTGRQKRNANRFTLGRAFRYNQERRTRIDEKLAEFVSGPRPCEIREMTATWLAGDPVPSPLVLNFLPAMAEIRIFETELFIDTGVLQAGGSDQTVRQIVALLYRNLAAVPGANPIESDGEAAVAECLRVMMNEGVAGYIEQTTDIEFDQKHPSLYKVVIIPTEFYRKAQQTMANFENWLPPMFAEAAVMNDRGRRFARDLTGNNAFSQTGIAMAAVIAARLGEDTLRQVRQSVPDFFAAYQRAALRNATPVPEPGAKGIEFYESVPPVVPEVYEPLHALLTRYFAAP